jgi:hypothetical protein
MKFFDDLDDDQRADILGVLNSSVSSDLEKLTRCIVVWLRDELTPRPVPAPPPAAARHPVPSHGPTPKSDK